MGSDSLEVEEGTGDWTKAAACSALGPRPLNEDAHLLRCDWEGGDSDAALFAVCDGHGGSGGAKVSKWVAKQLPAGLKELLECRSGSEDARKTAVECSFLALDRRLRRTEGIGHLTRAYGTTCVVAAAWPLTNGKAARRGRSRSRSPPAKSSGRYQVLFANVGDSRGILYRPGKGILMQTSDHRPAADEEMRRIKDAGGFLSEPDKLNPPRVDGILACARAFGDFCLKADRQRVPEGQKISCLPDTYECAAEAGDLIVLGCDGVFDVLSSEDTASLAQKTLDASGSPKEAAEAVVREALRLKTTDNVTCVVACLGEEKSARKSGR
eukprot:TRINITY_DN3873_c0_g1_i1.p1 TRINITY_DN3873_c0_g1~~TRINITY_DN3873_c0_g1_i1.p1  ORF type:complete len:353 (+),score=62.06 TRINITY_DN3873_c0_g1_i1:86-1060(+)